MGKDANRPDRRRRLLLAGTLLGPLAAAGAAGLPRVGLLIAETVDNQSDRLAALKAGMQDLGYVDGRTVVYDVRAANGDYARLPGLAADLVRAQPNVIVAFGIKALVAAREATATLPIVIPSTSSDLLAMGLVTNLARHAGNITGSMTLGPEIMAERLELLKEVAPGAQRVGVLVNPANTSFAPTQSRMEASAAPLRIGLQIREARSVAEIPAAIGTLARSRIDALVVQDDTLFAANAASIADRAIAQRWPSVGPEAYAIAGGLLGFGVSDVALYQRGAYFVDRLLKGARAGDLPIERATRFVLAINLRSARALGLSIPQAVRIRADDVIG